MRPAIFACVVLLAALTTAAGWADYAAEVQKDAPVAWLRFQDASAGDGAAAKDAAGAHAGTYRGAVAIEAGPAGIGGKAARFDGKSGYVEIANHKDFALNTISVECWFRSTQGWTAPNWPASATLVSKGTEGAASSDWVLLGGSAAGRQGCAMARPGPKPGADAVTASPENLTDGTWHHVVWTRAGDGQTRLYVDGTLVTSVKDSGGTITNDRPIQIGGDPWLKGKFLDGALAEVAIYKTALDESRVAAHVKAAGMEPKKWPAIVAAVPVGAAAAKNDRGPLPSPRPLVLKPDALQRYAETFNANDKELYAQHVPNAAALTFLQSNVPLLDCPDKEIEEVYYFRWWTYRKHIQETPDGFIISEFLPKVGWAGKHNSINCAAGHHLREGRWLADPKYLDDYSVFWFRKGGDARRYSFWAADSIWAHAMVTGDDRQAKDLLPDLIRNYEAWEGDHRDSNGLFWQVDDRDGMEASISGRLHPKGQGYRATINSYMYGDALAIAAIAGLAGKKDVAERFRAKAAEIKKLVQERLWDAEAQFFKVLPRGEGTQLSDAREEHGYTPWYFNLPDADKVVAWKQLMDPKGFYAPFGPTTAEQRHPGFVTSYQGHECQWNGPSWPFSTAVTLTALANLLNTQEQNAVSRKDYFETLKIYTRSHRLRLEDGRTVPWIDENLNPATGDWISRTRLKAWKNGTWDAGKGGEERGKDYNHSAYCDLVISGLVGLRPRADETVEVNPLVPETWDWFCLDQVRYHGRWLTILYDKTGERYKRGKGLRVFADGKEVTASETLSRLMAPLPPREAPPAEVETTAGWVKYEGNPVLGGKLGTCFDISVLKDGDAYRMWFSWRSKKSVALVESKDGTHWGDPVIVLGPNKETDWEADINRPVVLKKGGTYHMWYTGQAKGRSWIGYATSPDGVAWIRMSDKPVLSPEKPWEKVAVMCPHVLWDEPQRLFRLWYSGGEQYEPDAIGYAASTDGLAWTRHEANPIIKPDPSIPWEQHRTTGVQIIRQGDWHLMFYIGFRDVDHAQIGVARSRDGITNWQKHPANPIIRPGIGKWDHDACYKPYAIFDGKKWLLWYNGRHGGVEQIGVVLHEGEDLGFEKDAVAGNKSL